METTKTIKPEDVQHIEGRRWFQKTYGNTYHRTILHLKNGELERSDIHYGYGEQFLQTAYTMMGVPTQDYEGTRGLRENWGITYTVSDVERKKDL